MPRFRTGTKVAINVYDGDRPIFQAHSEADAAEWVTLLNVGHRHGAITTDEIAAAFTSAAERHLGVEPGEWVCFDGFDAEHLAAVVMNLLLRSPETPPQPPVVEIDDGEARPAKGALDLREMAREQHQRRTLGGAL